jgi:hypothetical protein
MQEPAWQSVLMFSKFLDKNIALINDSLSYPDIKAIWAPGADKVDVLLTMPLAGNEIGYYVAYKLNATMVIW